MHGFGYKSADLEAVKMCLQLSDVLLLKYNIYFQTLLNYWNNLNIVYWKYI